MWISINKVDNLNHRFTDEKKLIEQQTIISESMVIFHFDILNGQLKSTFNSLPARQQSSKSLFPLHQSHKLSAVR